MIGHVARRLQLVLLAGSFLSSPLLAQGVPDDEIVGADTGANIDTDRTIVATGRAQKLYPVDETTSVRDRDPEQEEQERAFQS